MTSTTHVHNILFEKEKKVSRNSLYVLGDFPSHLISNVESSYSKLACPKLISILLGLLFTMSVAIVLMHGPTRSLRTYKASIIHYFHFIVKHVFEISSDPIYLHA